MDRKSQREWVVKVLFEMDFNSYELEDIERILENHDLKNEKFIKDSLFSTYSNLEKIDGLIKNNLKKLSFNNMPKIDKAILRTSINEFVIEKSVPTSVSINEAVEISKKYSREDSFKFINGILSSIAKEM
ncbi:MAG: transcription antitermination factor NusB [Tissierellia bacterium]|nr:transcription antitermination factor NusB [Tissierellia bacterium]